MKFEARPAWPLPNEVLAFLSFCCIAYCSSCDVLNPANDGMGMSECCDSWFVGRVNGGFIITRSQDARLTETECTLLVCDSCPPIDSPVANKE